MSNYRAEPLSNANICDLAQQFRRHLGIPAKAPLNIVAILEFALPQLEERFNYEVREEADMEVRGAHAYTDHDRKVIVLREDVYNGARDGKGRDRLTVAHEIAHFLFHDNQFMKLARTMSGEQIKTYEDPEWQANAFAGELLCPAVATRNLSIVKIADKFGVSREAAQMQKRKGERSM